MINIVNFPNFSNERWIVDDIVSRISLVLKGVPYGVEISDAPLLDADGYFCFNYPKLRFFQGKFAPNAPVHYYLTHIDTKAKHQLIESYAAIGFVGCAMSHETFRRVTELSDYPDRFRFVSPVSMLEAREQKFRVLICSKVYADGRKREGTVVDMSKCLTDESITFDIMGVGWEAIACELRALGFEVNLYPEFVFDRYLRLLESASLLLYPGFDEGAISVLDAIVVGTPVLCTAQGFHLNYLNYPGVLQYSSLGEMVESMRGLIHSHYDQIRLRKSAADWSRYARELLSPLLSRAAIGGSS